LASSEAQGNLSFHQTPLPAPTPYIRVANVDSVSARLAAEGIIITPVSGHRSIKAFTVSDPFGNVLEFFEAR
jgi:hypothetical protein